ncbi:MAG: TetR/AcrR family transcriptional regulator [bacterium]
MAETTQKVRAISGRPRDPAIELEAIEATLNILASHGYDEVSFTKVSQMTGIARPTLKRRWKTRDDICLAAIRTVLDQPEMTNLPEDLSLYCPRTLILERMCKLADTLNDSRNKRILGTVLAASLFMPPLNEIRDYILSRHGINLRRILTSGIERGIFPKSTNIEVILDSINGAIIYRTLILGGQLSHHRVEQLIDELIPIA